MATCPERVQRRTSGGSPLISVRASRSAENKVVLPTIVVNESVRRRADELDAEAAYYRRRAIQEQQALGPGYYVDLLRDMATDRAAMAQRIRSEKRKAPTR